jgi:hypothetical protein
MFRKRFLLPAGESIMLGNFAKGENNRSKMFNNRRLRGDSTEEGDTGEWRTLHNEERHNTCYSPNIIRLVKLWGEDCGDSFKKHLRFHRSYP